MSTSISYKGKVIAAFGNETKTLDTAGTWLEDNIIVTAADEAGVVTVIQELDGRGGIIKHINAVDLSHDTVDAAHLLQGYTAHDRNGNAIIGTYTTSTTSDLQNIGESEKIQYYYTGDLVPSSSLGQDGDIYFSKAYKKVDGNWVLLSDLTSAFQSSINYVKGET